MRTTLLLLIVLLYHFQTVAQTTDSTKNITTFSGSIGITNNGFSIVPTFSLNSPATNMLFSIRKNRFSFDPDIRLVPDMTKGGFLFWFRYRFIETPKFSLSGWRFPISGNSNGIFSES